MSVGDTYVGVRIDKPTKQRANKALDAMGLSASDVIRLLMRHIADENRLPYDMKTHMKTPSKSSEIALAEIASGKLASFDSLDELMADLHAED